jgi:tetratricopeptide (TPR) repeat protein
MLTIESKANQLELNKIIRAYDAEDYIHVSDLCDSYMQKLGKDPNFLYMYGYSLRKINQIEKSDSVLSLGTNYSSNPMFWNVMGNNSLTQGRYREAEERYKHAFYMVPNRLYPLYLLAKLYYTEGDTVRFLQMAEMVEEFIPKVESVNTESLRTEIRELKSTLIMTNNCDQ